MDKIFKSSRRAERIMLLILQGRSRCIICWRHHHTVLWNSDDLIVMKDQRHRNCDDGNTFLFKDGIEAVSWNMLQRPYSWSRGDGTIFWGPVIPSSLAHVAMLSAMAESVLQLCSFAIASRFLFEDLISHFLTRRQDQREVDLPTWHSVLRI